MGDNGGGVGDRLRHLLERIEEKREEIARLKEDERDIFTEAKSAGLDIRTMREVLKWRAMEATEREERRALFEIYVKALGEYGDTPLGSAALKRLAPAPPPPPPRPHHEPRSEEEDTAPFAGAAEAPAGPTPEEMLAAKAEGAAAAKAGKPVLENPYTDARRAAWDEGWCAAQGSDGMDIPAAFRRTRPKKGKGGEDGAGAGGEA